LINGRQKMLPSSRFRLRANPVAADGNPVVRRQIPVVVDRNPDASKRNALAVELNPDGDSRGLDARNQKTQS
jgi:hypothetical protein